MKNGAAADSSPQRTAPAQVRPKRLEDPCEEQMHPGRIEGVVALQGSRLDEVHRAPHVAPHVRIEVVERGVQNEYPDEAENRPDPPDAPRFRCAPVPAPRGPTGRA